MRIAVQPSLGDRAQAFQAKLVDYLKRETQTIAENTCLLASSDILESLFGKYKLFSAKSPPEAYGAFAAESASADHAAVN